MTLRVEQAGRQLAGAAETLEHLRPGLELLALRTLGSADASREAVQETLARAVVALANGQPSDLGKLPAFVAGIARHVVVDMVRAQRRIVSLDSLPLTEHPAPAADALSALVSTEEHARVRAALGSLSATDRALLRDCYVEGLSPTEIAARSREPAERVRKRKSRALDRLRAAFRGSDATRHAEAHAPTVEEEGGPAS